MNLLHIRPIVRIGINSVIFFLTQYWHRLNYLRIIIRDKAMNMINRESLLRLIHTKNRIILYTNIIHSPLHNIIKIIGDDTFSKLSFCQNQITDFLYQWRCTRVISCIKGIMYSIIIVLTI